MFFFFFFGLRLGIIPSKDCKYKGEHPKFKGKTSESPSKILETLQSLIAGRFWGFGLQGAGAYGVEGPLLGFRV